MKKIFMINISFIIIFTLLNCTDEPPTVVNEPDESLGKWLTKTPMPTKRQELAAELLNDKIYVVGGMNRFGVPLKTVEVYDPVSDTWSAAAPLPRAKHHLSLSAVDGKLYAIGGCSTTFPEFNDTKDVFEFDPTANKWLSKSPLLHARNSHTSVSYDNKIYVFGGLRQNSNTASAEVYDPLTDLWIRIRLMPTSRNHLAVAVIDSLIYVVGGREIILNPDRYTVTNYHTLEIYSPATNTWISAPDMPTARGGLAAASLNGKLFVFGGEFPGVYSRNEMYDPSTMSWKTLAPMPTARHGTFGVTFNEGIYLIGGGIIAGIAPSDVNEVFIP